MQVKLTLRPGQPGTVRLTEKYGERLVAVRYRYDQATQKRYKTVELIETTVDWSQGKETPWEETHPAHEPEASPHPPPQEPASPQTIEAKEPPKTNETPQDKKPATQPAVPKEQATSHQPSVTSKHPSTSPKANTPESGGFCSLIIPMGDWELLEFVEARGGFWCTERRAWRVPSQLVKKLGLEHFVLNQ